MPGSLASGAIAQGETLGAAFINPVTLTGTIAAASGDGVYGPSSSAWTVVNAGWVIGDAVGIALGGGGVVRNTASAAVQGGSGVTFGGAPASLHNEGVIAGSVAAGVSLVAGGSVVNRGHATIAGVTAGVAAQGKGFVDNSGTVLAAGSGAAAIYLASGGSVINRYGAVVSSAQGPGVAIGAGGTVVNQGTIIGTPYAVEMPSGGTLDIVPGAVFVGGLDGGIGSVLNLEPGAEPGTLTGIGSIITGFDTIVADVGADWTLTGANTVSAGVKLMVDGTLANTGRLAGYVDLYGGVLTNAAGGTIAGGYYGVIGDPNRIGGLVDNAGAISASELIGIKLREGGALDNEGSGTITGPWAGVYFSGDDGTLVNDGRIAATGTGRYSVGAGFFGGATVSNGATAVISGHALGVAVYDGTASVTNAGRIDGVGSLGVALYYGGSVTNTGTILGGQVAVYLNAGKYSSADASAGMVINSGVLSAGNDQVFSVGVQAFGPSKVVNQAGGTIAGAKYGVSIERGAGTVVNAGTIAAPVSVYMEAGYRNLLVVDPGAVFIGTVDGGNAIGSTIATSTLELAAGQGTLTGLGSQFVDFGSIVVDPGAAWTLAGVNTLALGAGILDEGFLSVGSLAGGGAITLAAGATLQLTAGTMAVTFAPSADAGMVVPVGGMIAAPVAGFAAGDWIGVAEHVASAVASHGTVTITGTGGGRTVLTDVAGVADGTLAAIWNASSGMTAVEVPCLAAGTRLLTPAGERLVETLTVGDRVRTLLPAGEDEIVWIGSRRIDCRRHPRPSRVWPIQIEAGAFAPGVPERAVFVSPDHAIFAAGVLIPARLLANGSSVRQVERASVEYWHVELRRHGVMLADGLPAESFLDVGGYTLFAGRGGAVALHPDMTALTWEASGCAPLVLAGPKLAEARRMLAGYTPSTRRMSRSAPSPKAARAS